VKGQTLEDDWDGMYGKDWGRGRYEKRARSMGWVERVPSTEYRRDVGEPLGERFDVCWWYLSPEV